MADSTNPVERMEAAWRAGNAAEAKSLADRVLAEDPVNLGALMIQANLCFAADDVAGARPYLAQLAQLMPGDVMIRNNLGRAHLAAGDLDAAMAMFAEVLSQEPENSRALDGMGIVRHRQGEYALAADLHGRAAAAEPGFAAAWCNLGIAYTDLARFEDGAAALDRALSLDPDDARSRFNRAILSLSSSDWQAGWPLYEARLAFQATVQPEGARWHGQMLDGEPVLLVPEQGFGDVIQFARFARRVEERGGKPVLVVPGPLMALLSEQDWGIEVVDADAPLSASLWCPLMSLPGIFNLRPGDVDGRAYIRAPGISVKSDRYTGLRVGIVWSGNPAHRRDRERSLALADLVPLLETPGVSFINLQVGTRSADAGVLAERPGLFTETPRLENFAMTADAVAGLDMVISADTSVLHLAGAMGCPVWGLLPAVADWRWGREGAQTPWYDSLRLYRQPAPGNWTQPLEAVAADLRRLAAD